MMMYIMLSGVPITRLSVLYFIQLWFKNDIVFLKYFILNFEWCFSPTPNCRAILYSKRAVLAAFYRQTSQIKFMKITHY